MNPAELIEAFLTTGIAAAILFTLWTMLKKKHVAAAGPFKARWTPFESVVMTIGIFVFSNILAGALIGIALASMGTEDISAFIDSSTLTNFVYMLMFELIIVAALLAFIKRRGAAFSSIGLKRPQPKDLLFALIGFGAYFAMYIGVYLVAQEFIPWIDFEQEQELGFSTDVTGPALALVFVSLVIIAPIAEEIICRGFLFSGLRTKLAFIPAAIITSVIFAAAHLQIGYDAPLLWVAAIDTFILSMVMVYMRERTNSLASPIFLHMIKNGLAFIALFVAPRLVF